MYACVPQSSDYLSRQFTFRDSLGGLVSSEANEICHNSLQFVVLNFEIKEVYVRSLATADKFTNMN